MFRRITIVIHCILFQIPGVLVGRVGLQITTIVGGSYLPSQELFSNSNGVALFSFPG